MYSKHGILRSIENSWKTCALGWVPGRIVRILFAEGHLNIQLMF
jgi:hypothetical protein